MVTTTSSTPKLAAPASASSFSFASLFSFFEKIPAEVQAILPELQAAEAIFAQFIHVSPPTAGAAVVVEPKGQ